MKTCVYLFLICLVSAIAGAGVVNYEYDDAGRLTGVHYEGVSRASYIYDPMGNLICAGDTCDIFVETSKTCGGKKPCYELINLGVRASGACANLKISSDSPFSENVLVSQDTQLIMQGGWIPDFSQKTDMTDIAGSLTIEKGTLTVDGISITKSTSP